ncbi:MAG: DUF11 domain-containing protein [Methanophagales archaeon]|nr:DUF11 domain-containing protein [Methanophagales archaeon]
MSRELDRKGEEKAEQKKMREKKIRRTITLIIALAVVLVSISGALAADTSWKNPSANAAETAIKVDKTVAVCALCPFESRLPVKIGDTVFYRYIVTNTGDVTLTGITVNDDIYGPVTLGKNTLAPGESTEGTITHVVVESDAPTVTDTATATGTDPLGGTVTDTDDCTINVAIAAPAITVVKTASPTEGAPSTNVTFTTNVTNTGNCTLDPVKVVDTLPAGMSYVATGTSPTPDSAVEKPDGTWTITWDNVGPLAASESKTITLIGHIDGDVLGTLTDSVTVTGTPPIGGNVTDSNTADVTALASSIKE